MGHGIQLRNKIHKLTSPCTQVVMIDCLAPHCVLFKDICLWSEFALPLWESISHITVYLNMSVTDQCKEKKRGMEQGLAQEQLVNLLINRTNIPIAVKLIASGAPQSPILKRLK